MVTTGHRPLRLCVLTTGYPHEGDAVAGGFVRDLALALRDRGHALAVHCARRDDPLAGEPLRDPGLVVRAHRYAPDALGARLFSRGGAPDRLRSRAPRALLGALCLPPALLAALAREPSLRDADALLSHFALPCGAVAAALRLAGRAPPHVALAHGTDARWLGALPSPAQRALLAGADGLWCSHEAARAALCPALRASPRTRVHPVGYAPPAAPLVGAPRAARRGSLGLAPDELLLVCVARCVPVKGLDALVEALRPGDDAPRAVRAVVLGDGPERAALEARARALSAPVRFLGAVTADERDRYLAAADLFALPSRALAATHAEGAPIAALEALGAGLPCVLSDLPGLRELAGDAARYVPPGTPDALRTALRGLAADAPLRARLGERARERAAERTFAQSARWLEHWLYELGAP